MSRKCSTCQHVKRAEIDRRLAAGEPGNHIAHDYDLNPSSLHRHRVNCLGLSSSNAIMKEVARGTAAVACLPSKDDLNSAYFDLRTRIDEIVAQAQAQGSLAVAIAGLNSLRHTLDSLSGSRAMTGRSARKSMSRCRTTCAYRPRHSSLERLSEKFDQEPELKARIAQALVEIDDGQAA